ncbi:MAG: ATP-binding protein [Candidatus Acidiferrales bacterium]
MSCQIDMMSNVLAVRAEGMQGLSHYTLKGRTAMPPKLPLSRLSFRSQVLLLGGFVAILFVAVLIASFAALRYTKASVLSDEKKQLLQTTRALAQEYSDKADFARRNNEVPPLEEPSSDSSNSVLTLLSRVVLQNAEGVEGGFYARSTDTLLGYSFPTRRAEDNASKNISSTERLAILQTAHEAAVRHEPSEKVLVNPPDIILIEAAPVGGGEGDLGSAWVLKRLPSLPGHNRLRAYLTIVALGVAALICVLLTLFVVRNLQSGVLKIEGGLEGLERDLGSEIALGNDPGEIKRIGSAINRLAAILRQKIESGKQIEDRLRHAERLAALGRLIAGVAHEVRNPLATIRLRVQMCQQVSQDPNVHESCAVALEEIERLNGMVSRLLNFSQPVQLHPEPTNLRVLLDQRLEGFAERARTHHVRFITNFMSDPQTLLVDQSRMSQVFDNVIQNAIEAMADSGGTLCVSLTPDGSRCLGKQDMCLEFNDTGSGISPAIAGRVFDPFFTTKAKGTGLGLSICHELVRAHGGEIRVVSGNGHGTTVRILLPLSDAVSALREV